MNWCLQRPAWPNNFLTNISLQQVDENDDVIKWRHPPTQRPVTQGYDAFLDLRLNKRFSEQTKGQSLKTPSRSLWRDCNRNYHLWSDTSSYCVVHWKPKCELGSFNSRLLFGKRVLHANNVIAISRYLLGNGNKVCHVPDYIWSD